MVGEAINLSKQHVHEKKEIQQELYTVTYGL